VQAVRFNHFNHNSNSRSEAYVSLFVNPSEPLPAALSSVSTLSNPFEWGIDTHANRCLTPSKDHLRSYVAFATPGSVSALGGGLLPAVKTAVYVRNMLPHSALSNNITPLEHLL
jgi:hypothetical protein